MQPGQGAHPEASGGCCLTYEPRPGSCCSSPGKGRLCSEKPPFMGSLASAVRRLRSLFVSGGPWSGVLPLTFPQLVVCCLTVGWMFVHNGWPILVSRPLILSF